MSLHIQENTNNKVDNQDGIVNTSEEIFPPLIVKQLSPPIISLMSEYSHVFSKNKYDVGKIRIEPTRINLTLDLTVSQRAYRTSATEEVEINKQITNLLAADDTLKELILILEKDNEDRTKEAKQKVQNYVLKGYRLFRVITDGARERLLLFVIPKSKRKSIVVKFHDLMGHFAVDKTVSKIKELYWFPYMKRYVCRHMSIRFECLVNKIPSGKRQGFLHSIPTGRRPFAIVHLDHLGPFVTSSKRNKELLLITDNMTRFVLSIL
ncbi:hypothetical protein AVEN_34645-1 [Araneus ventricosus]|uniref:RNA-directed DNA polymerase n=1 Tax=Araneus ventricosus TaxID=182803 RepID=A0A4Y2AZG1_ARAVE|nr:hypothetical protein AVEN_34645-1 [Araneus ventricosus]